MDRNWKCPSCDHAQTVTSARTSNGRLFYSVGETKFGKIGLDSIVICCANPQCLMPSVHVGIRPWDYLLNGSEKFIGESILSVRLMPDSRARPQPEYIPCVLRDDYVEACKIRDLSPKASATLARRCLQGMIRDFCGISEPTLYREIETLKKSVEAGEGPKGVSIDSVEAIDYIRKIGNIGAHMEKDINVIVDVDPEEAQVLIELIETLFEEWYVERQKRSERFARVKEIADAKEHQKKTGNS